MSRGTPWRQQAEAGGSWALWQWLLLVLGIVIGVIAVVALAVTLLEA